MTTGNQPLPMLDVRIAQLSPRFHSELPAFACGDSDLDAFLQDDAWRLQDEHVARTYLSLEARKGALAGYVTLLNDAVLLLTREKRSLGLTSDDHPVVPALKIARLAVSSSYERQGVGLALVRHAYFAAQEAEAISGCRLVTVDAYPDAEPFYERLGFKRNRAKEYRDREHPSLRLDVFGKHTPEWL